MRRNGHQNKVRIGVIRAGISESSFDDHVIFAKRDSVGGPWHGNRYKGIAFDTQAHVYCYSFARSTELLKSRAPGAGICA